VHGGASRQKETLSSVHSGIHGKDKVFTGRGKQGVNVVVHSNDDTGSQSSGVSSQVGHTGVIGSAGLYAAGSPKASTGEHDAGHDAAPADESIDEFPLRDFGLRAESGAFSAYAESRGLSLSAGSARSMGVGPSKALESFIDDGVHSNSLDDEDEDEDDETSRDEHEHEHEHEDEDDETSRDEHEHEHEHEHEDDETSRDEHEHEYEHAGNTMSSSGQHSGAVVALDPDRAFAASYGGLSLDMMTTVRGREHVNGEVARTATHDPGKVSEVGGVHGSGSRSGGGLATMPMTCARLSSVSGLVCLAAPCLFGIGTMEAAGGVACGLMRIPLVAAGSMWEIAAVSGGFVMSFVPSGCCGTGGELKGKKS